MNAEGKIMVHGDRCEVLLTHLGRLEIFMQQMELEYSVYEIFLQTLL